MRSTLLNFRVCCYAIVFLLFISGECIWGMSAIVLREGPLSKEQHSTSSIANSMYLKKCHWNKT